MNTFIHSNKLENILEKFPIKLIKTVYRIKYKKCPEQIKNSFEMIIQHNASYPVIITKEYAYEKMNEQMNYLNFAEALHIPYFYYHTKDDRYYYRFFMPAPNEEMLLNCFSDIEQLALLI